MTVFDSHFEQAMQNADAAIMEEMAVPFTLKLRDGQLLTVRAIYDTRLAPASGTNSAANARNIDAAYESSALTVLGERLDRQLIHGAIVSTPYGDMAIAQVFYPDPTTTAIVLGMPGIKNLPSGDGERWRK